jgi:hypothetical protein
VHLNELAINWGWMMSKHAVENMLVGLAAMATYLLIASVIFWVASA